MMEWTDRHCRMFYRFLTRRALLYTEMVVAEAVLRGDRDRLLAFSEAEHPVAAQLGGSDPDRFAAAAAIAADFGYDEINLNVGCPSDRVRDGRFGACLMHEPRLVGEIVAAAKSAVDIPVTVKCRIGVDDQDSQTALDELAGACFAAAADGLWVHARKAWLSGLSPKENRDVPPLDHDRVWCLKKAWPHRFVGVNGGIDDLDAAAGHLSLVDGVMMGRAVYHDPGLLADVDHRFFGDPRVDLDLIEVVHAYLPYVERQLADGVRLHHITRHMLGLFHGRPGARRWRRILSAGSASPGAGVDVIRQALAAVGPHAYPPSQGAVMTALETA